MLDEHYRKLERMYDSAPINRIYAPTITVSQGRAEIAMAIGHRLFSERNSALREIAAMRNTENDRTH